MTTTDESIFRYDDGITHDSFIFADFTPRFLDEQDAAALAEANTICNNVQSCVFDYFATGNRALAEASANTAETSETVASQISKYEL